MLQVSCLVARQHRSLTEPVARSSIDDIGPTTISVARNEMPTINRIGQNYFHGTSDAPSAQLNWYLR